MQLHSSFNFGDFGFLSEQGYKSIDVVVVVLDDIGIFKEGLLFFCVGGFVLKEGG